EQLLQVHHRLDLLHHLVQLPVPLGEALGLAGVVGLSQVALAPLQHLRQRRLLAADVNQRFARRRTCLCAFTCLLAGGLLFSCVSGAILGRRLPLRVIEPQNGPKVPLQPVVIQRHLRPLVGRLSLRLCLHLHLPVLPCDSAPRVIAQATPRRGSSRFWA